jgi:type IV pilus assembly protein PilV
MSPIIPARHRQSGAYLLEALVGILIFSLGILGIVGLQAAALRSTSDDAIRAEMVLLANQLLGQMWADDPAALKVNYDSNLGTGVPWQNFATQVQNTLGGAWDSANPANININVNVLPGPSINSSRVDIVIHWKSCMDQNCDTHFYQTSAVIGT